MTKRVFACTARSLGELGVVVVPLSPSAEGLRRQAVVVRDERGEVKAYRNLCKHLPILLDGGTGMITTRDRVHLLCVTHGARYRREDGLCVEGPCRGASLDRLDLVDEDGELYVLDRA